MSVLPFMQKVVPRRLRGPGERGDVHRSGSSQTVLRRGAGDCRAKAQRERLGDRKTDGVRGGCVGNRSGDCAWACTRDGISTLAPAATVDLLPNDGCVSAGPH